MKHLLHHHFSSVCREEFAAGLNCGDGVPEVSLAAVQVSRETLLQAAEALQTTDEFSAVVNVAESEK